MKGIIFAAALLIMNILAGIPNPGWMTVIGSICAGFLLGFELAEKWKEYL